MPQEPTTSGFLIKLKELAFIGVAAVLALPGASLGGIQSELALDAWRNRLGRLSRENELTGVVAGICRARYEALGLQLDLLRAYEDGGDIEDFTLRRRWFRAGREAIAAHVGSNGQNCNFQLDNLASFQALESDLREEAASILHEGLRLELSDTRLPICLDMALTELDRANVGIFDAFALFFASHLKENIRFRDAVLLGDEPEQTIFGVDEASYLQTLFTIATTIARRFDTRLNHAASAAPTTGAESISADPDLEAYWIGIALTVADAVGSSRATLSAIAEHARAKTLNPIDATRIIRKAAGLLQQVRAELAEDSGLDRRVSQILDEHGPCAALELLASLTKSTLETEIPSAAISPASIARLKGWLLQLTFDYRRAIGQHVIAVELSVARGEETRAQYICSLVEALVCFGQDLKNPEPLQRAAAMCAKLLESAWLQPGSRLWIEIKRHHADALAEQARQQYNGGHLEKAASIYGEILAAPPLGLDNSIVCTFQLSQGQTLLLLGARPGKKATQEQAVGILRDAAIAARDSHNPYQIALSHLALGDALLATAMGEQRSLRLNEAAQIYEAARLAISYDSAPIEWIKLYFRLGTVMGTLARDTKDGKQIYDALSLLETALQGIPAGLFKDQRAEILLEVGHLHATLAIGDRWYVPLQRTIEAYDRALAEPELKSQKSFLWAQNKQRWAAAKLRMARHHKDAELIGAAIEALLEVLQSYDLQKHSRQYANVQHDLGSAFSMRAEFIPNHQDLSAAEAAFLQAVELRSPDQLPVPWAQSILGLASVLCVAIEANPSRMPALQAIANQLQRALGLEALQNNQRIINNIASRLTQVRGKLANTERQGNVSFSADD
jgi:hypothetical protein